MTHDILGRMPSEQEIQKFQIDREARRQERWIDALHARKAAEEEVQILEKLVASHQREHERLEMLEKRALVSEDQVDRSERELLEARLRLGKARAALRQTER